MTNKTAKTTAKARTAPEPVQLHEIRQIPLSLLEADDANVRTIKNGVTIEMLADDIAFRGLLQSLAVREATDAQSKATGRFGVIAGGRRLKALQLLAKKKRIEPDQPINCTIVTGGSAADHSLAENVFREQLHPFDQFTAFKTMADDNIPDADIAKRYHVTEKFVRQRLKLAAASPKLLKAFQQNEISLEKLEAFCVTDDHKRQNAILKLIEDGHHYNAFGIRNALTETSIDADDPRARYVGLDAYKAAGGAIMEDLFKDNAGPWLEDPQLLDKLATDKIEAERQTILACGFKWAEVSLDPDNVFELKRNLHTIPNMPSALTKEERALHKELSAEYDELFEKADYEDEDNPFTEADADRLAEIEAILLEFRNRAPKLSAKQIARTGVIISLDDDGRLAIEYGFLKPEDVKQAKKAAAKAKADTPSDESGDDDFEETYDADEDTTDYVRADNNPAAIVAGKPVSDSLARDLTSYRTVALQNAVAQDFNIAFLASLHALCASLFYVHEYGGSDAYKSAIKIAPTKTAFRGVEGLDDFKASKEIADRHAGWIERLPEDSDALWNALSLLTNEERADLFSHCVSLSLDDIHGNQGRGSNAQHADQLAEAVSLDMAASGWESTSDNYFGRVNKDQILAALKEAAPTKVAYIEHLKKAVMAQEAERLIKDTGWLPPLLRAPFAATGQDAGDDQIEVETDNDAPAEALPEFLQGGVNGASPASAA